MPKELNQAAYCFFFCSRSTTACSASLLAASNVSFKKMAEITWGCFPIIFPQTIRLQWTFCVFYQQKIHLSTNVEFPGSVWSSKWYSDPLPLFRSPTQHPLKDFWKFDFWTLWRKDVNNIFQKIKRNRKLILVQHHFFPSIWWPPKNRAVKLCQIPPKHWFQELVRLKTQLGEGPIGSVACCHSRWQDMSDTLILKSNICALQTNDSILDRVPSNQHICHNTGTQKMH